jgi:trehalose-6-phosphatase
LQLISLGSEVSELSGKDTKTVDAEEDIAVEDEVLDELCDKITLAAGVTAKDKRLKDALTESLREENIKRMKKIGDKGGNESGKGRSQCIVLLLMEK